MESAVYQGEHFSITSVGNGCWAAIVGPQSPAVGNAGFVDMGDSIVVFDTMNTPQAAQELRAAIRQLTQKPVSHVINSHWHGDHMRGNQVFSDALILSTETTRSLMAQIHPERIASQKGNIAELDQYLGELDSRIQTGTALQAEELQRERTFLAAMRTSLMTLELRLPEETFLQGWSRQGTARRVDVETFGPSHTASDSVLFVPDARGCFVGDLVVVNGHLAVADGDVGHWISVLQQLQNRDIDWIVPGHGPTGRAVDLERAVLYLRDMQELASRWVGDDVSEADIPEQYRHLSDAPVFVRNLKHLVAQRGA